MRCAYLLHRWSSAGEVVRFVRWLVRRGLPGRRAGAVGHERVRLQELGQGGATSAGGRRLRRSAASGADCCRSPAMCDVDLDAFDALVAALVARAALLRSDLPPRARRSKRPKRVGSICHCAAACPLWPFRRASRAVHRERCWQVGWRSSALRSTPRATPGAWMTHCCRRSRASSRTRFARTCPGKGGSELVARANVNAKFQAAHSSACLAANAFGPWLVTEEAVPFGGDAFVGEVHLEVQRRRGCVGRRLTLDCLFVDGAARARGRVEVHGNLRHPRGGLQARLRWRCRRARTPGLERRVRPP